MPDLTNLAYFVGAAMVLLIIPGPAVMYVVARSLEGGRIAGIVSTLGIAVGTLFHVFAVAFGAAAFLMNSDLAFSVLSYAGAAYLVFLGMKQFWNKSAVEKEAQRTHRLGRIFYEGILVNLLNPKTALFFFAFLPQFVDRAAPVTTQLIFLGLIFISIAIMSDGIFALFAGSLSKWLSRKPDYFRIQNLVSGFILIGLGFVAALAMSSMQ